mmetsp:Transcript_9960/g.40322  ORF Transcript_9960/g.40322 Transcript_9960/m.40322 type:complete len:210 (+) Transcript_9960:1010-1639(+)
MRIVLSAEPETMHLSTGEKFTHQTPRLWPFSVPFRASESDSHTFTILSWLPVATSESFGATATLLISLSCALIVLLAWQVSGSPFELPAFALVAGDTSQYLIVLSAPPVTMKSLLFREKATAPMLSVCPEHTAMHSLVSRSQTRAVWSLLPEAAMRPSEEASIAMTTSVWPTNGEQVKVSLSKRSNFSLVAFMRMAELPSTERRPRISS